MLIVWKNKGLLVLLYLIVCFIGTAMLVGVLHRNVSGVFSKIDFYTTVGLAFLFASIWTYLTKDDYYKDREGNKKKMDTVNEFFWIKMKTWAFIFMGAALIFLGNLLFNYFDAIST